MPFAQLVIGPPGSGKTTYCHGLHQFLNAIGRRNSIINLDPANDRVSYPCALDIRDLVALEDVMDEEQLGPNGGMMYALEELEENIEWLETALERMAKEGEYVVFDCPGQVELVTHHGALRRILGRVEKLGYRLVVVHLVDAHYLSSASSYISVLLLCLRSMLQLGLPHINVLSKIDLLHNYTLDFPLSFYTEVQDLHYLLPILNDPSASRSAGRNPDDNDDDDTRMDDDGTGGGGGGLARAHSAINNPPPSSSSPHRRIEAPHRDMSKFAKLNEAIIDLVDGFSLVSFETLAVEDKKSMAHLLQAVDRAGGYAFGEAEGAGDSVWALAMRGGWAEGFEARDVQERWVDHREEWDEFERRKMEEEREREQGEVGMMG